MKKVLFFAAGAVLALAACDNVGSLTKNGMKAYEEGKYEEAIKDFNKAIEKDPQKSAEAARMLGIIYSDTVAGVKNDKQALEYFTKAAELGDSIAMYQVAYASDNGIGTLQDQDKAVKYYTMSADAGYPQAQAVAGWLYMRGYKGATKDEKKGAEYAKAASEAGNADGMAYLGFAYEQGLGGVEKNETKAAELYSQSAEAGSPDGKALLGKAYAFGELGLIPNVTKAEELIKSSIAAGSSLGMRYMGHLYSNNKIISNDGNGNSLNAINWYRKAAEAGNVDAMRNLAYNLADLYTWDKEKQAESVQWYQRAANQGDAASMCNLGWMYENGKGVTKSMEKAFEWYTKSAEAGDEVGQCNLANFYEYGKGTPVNKAKAIEWYKKAAEQGDEDAKRKLKSLGVK